MAVFQTESGQTQKISTAKPNVYKAEKSFNVRIIFYS